MKKSVISSIVILAAVVALFVSMAAFTSPSFAQKSNKMPVKLACHVLVVGTSNQPCIHQPRTRIVPLVFTGHWSQRVWVASHWTFRYVCDGSSPVDEYDVLDQYNTRNGPAWEVSARHIPLQCDGSWHSVAFQFRYSHIIQIGISRPVDALVSMEVQA